MDRREEDFPVRNRLGRRIGVVALAAIVGATVYGDNRGYLASATTDPVSSGALQVGASLGGAVSGLARTAQDAVTLGILSGTVLARMEPGVRRSILAAVEGLREVCTGRPAPPSSVSRCTARDARAKTPVRCTRA
jgi:hypothetical protein